MKGLAHFLDVLRGRVPADLVCTVDPRHRRSHMSFDEAYIFEAHRRLLCACGGSLIPARRAGGGR